MTRAYRRRVTAATMALITVAGCSGHHDGPPAGGTHRGAPTTTADAACPAPAPIPPGRVPHTLATRAGGDGWYGSGPLWTQGIDSGMTRARNGYRLKYGSFTLDDRGAMSGRVGRPRLTVRRVDGPGTGHGSVGAYGTTTGRGNTPVAFWPTVVTLSHSGCWQITESLHRTTLRFHIHAP